MGELSDAEILKLRRLLGWMIPADDGVGVPAADDDAVFADVIASLGREADAVREAIARLDARAGGAFAALGADAQRDLAFSVLADGGSAVVSLGRLVLQCYYRDERVMRSLDMEVRPPFPSGFEVEQGDWSLLDPVRSRPKIYREVS